MRAQQRRVRVAGSLLLIMVVALGLVAGCGRSSQLVQPATPPSSPSNPGNPSSPETSRYDGALYLAPDQRITDAERDGGAAGRVVRCSTRVTGKISRDVYEGAAMASPAGALKAAASEVGYYLTAADFVRERVEADRVLYTYRVTGVVKQALIIVRGPTMDRGKTGWHAETWASCDLSEYPDSVLASYGKQRWRDQQGRPAPTYVVSSGPGPAHCGWQQATFLTFDDRLYIGRAPEDLVGTYLPDTYARDVVVPSDASATGYIRSGSDSLWIAGDRSAAYLGSRQHAERLPAVTKEFGCA